MLYKVVLIIETVHEILKYTHSSTHIQVKATEQYFLVFLFSTVYYPVQGVPRMKSYNRFQIKATKTITFSGNGAAYISWTCYLLI